MDVAYGYSVTFHLLGGGLRACHSELEANHTLRFSFPTPPSTSTCTLAIFSIVNLGCHLQDNTVFPESLLEGKGKELRGLHGLYYTFCKNEHLQVDGGSVSSGCYHHPAAENMEKQVLCR